MVAQEPKTNLKYFMHVHHVVTHTPCHTPSFSEPLLLTSSVAVLGLLISLKTLVTGMPMLALKASCVQGVKPTNNF